VPAFLTDENFDRHILIGLLRHRPDIDIVRVQDVGLRTADDPTILTWAADNGRVLLTHDVSTISVPAYERVRNGDRMPGVIVVEEALSIGVAVRGILQMLEDTLDPAWEGLVRYLPASVKE
jgi:hypothetical protein